MFLKRMKFKNTRCGKPLVNNDIKVPQNGLLIWNLVCKEAPPWLGPTGKKILKIKTSTLAKMDSN